MALVLPSQESQAESIKMFGSLELMKVLKELGGKTSFSMAAKAGTFSMTPVLRAAISKAPVREKFGGTLRLSIAKRTIRNRRNGLVVSLVGIKKGVTSSGPIRTRGKNKGRSETINPRKYAHLVEEGHSPDILATRRPFMRPAWERELGNVQQRWRLKFNRELKTEVFKLKVRNSVAD